MQDFEEKPKRNKKLTLEKTDEEITMTKRQSATSISVVTSGDSNDAQSVVDSIAPQQTVNSHDDTSTIKKPPSTISSVVSRNKSNDSRIVDGSMSSKPVLDETATTKIQSQSAIPVVTLNKLSDVSIVDDFHVTSNNCKSSRQGRFRFRIK